MNEDATFRLLVDYLERTGDDVLGRSLEPPPEEVTRLLASFAAGGLPPAERVELAELLKRHPGWVSVLAGAAKALRGEREATEE